MSRAPILTYAAHLHAGTLVLGLAAAALAWLLSAFPEAQLRLLVSFNILLWVPLLVFTLRRFLRSVRTRALLQLAYLLLGIMMILAGVLGLARGSFMAALLFFTIMLLPGITLIMLGIRLRSASTEIIHEE